MLITFPARITREKGDASDAEQCRTDQPCRKDINRRPAQECEEWFREQQQGNTEQEVDDEMDDEPTPQSCRNDHTPPPGFEPGNRVSETGLAIIRCLQSPEGICAVPGCATAANTGTLFFQGTAPCDSLHRLSLFKCFGLQAAEQSFIKEFNCFHATPIAGWGSLEFPMGS